MKKYFVTCNKNKFKEIEEYILGLEQLCVKNSIEVQSLDSKYIIKEKLLDANNKANIKDGLLMVEDTGLYLKALNDFPGPLIKFMLESIGPAGIYKICNALDNFKAYAKTTFGLLNTANGEMQYFEGVVDGVISIPKGNYGFGWDQIFIPKGTDKTFAEMESIKEKNKFSMRYKAIPELISYLGF